MWYKELLVEKCGLIVKIKKERILETIQEQSTIYSYKNYIALNAIL